MPKISIIIPTKNEEKNLPRLLHSIKDQNFRDFEIIVVDNFSQDETLKIAQNFGAQVFQKGPERSTQRNFGAQKAKGKFLFFLDADMELEKNVLQECFDKINENKTIKSLIIPEKSKGKGFWGQVKALEKKCYLNDPFMETPRFFEKEIFKKLNGYDPNLIAAEDWDLAQRLKNTGAKVGRITSFIIHHENTEKFFVKNLQKKYFYAKNIHQYTKKHPQVFKKQAPLFLRSSFFINWRLLARNPFLTVGLFILKISETIMGVLGQINFMLTKNGQK